MYFNQFCQRTLNQAALFPVGSSRVDTQSLLTISSVPGNHRRAGALISFRSWICGLSSNQALGGKDASIPQTILFISLSLIRSTPIWFYNRINIWWIIPKISKTCKSNEVADWPLINVIISRTWHLFVSLGIFLMTALFFPSDIGQDVMCNQAYPKEMHVVSSLNVV
jgi:hypothetical protein